MMDKTNAQQALDFVKQQAASVETETDLHNLFFGIGGRFGQLFPTLDERETFRSSREYREICQIFESVGEKTSP
jgi:hypothetical protein